MVLLQMREPSTADGHWTFYALSQKTTLHRFTIKIQTSSIEGEVTVDEISESIHNFDYAFLQSTTSYRLSAASSLYSDEVLFSTRS